MTNKQKIEMNKEYTSNGKKVRILCTDRRSSEGYTVVALIDNWKVEYFTSTGELYYGRVNDEDLVEYNSWQDVAVDTKLLYSQNNVFFSKGHFAKYENGRTSFTNEPLIGADGLDSFPYNKLAE